MPAAQLGIKKLFRALFNFLPQLLCIILSFQKSKNPKIFWIETTPKQPHPHHDTARLPRSCEKLIRIARIDLQILSKFVSYSRPRRCTEACLGLYILPNFWLCHYLISHAGGLWYSIEGNNSLRILLRFCFGSCTCNFPNKPTDLNCTYTLGAHDQYSLIMATEWTIPSVFELLIISRRNPKLYI